MKRTTINQVAHRASYPVLALGAAAAVVGLTIATVNAPLAQAATTGADSPVVVTVDAITTSITQVNGTKFNNNDEVDSIAVRTYDATNEVHFKTDADAHVKLVLGDKVLWEGDTKADQPATAKFDLGKTSVGIYNIAIRAYTPGQDKSYSVTFFHLDYRATIPSVVPDNGNNNIYDNGGVEAPNTGLYMTIGGRIYSMTTVAVVLLLTAIAVYLICSKYSKKEAAPAKAHKAKTTRKKMDMI